MNAIKKFLYGEPTPSDTADEQKEDKEDKRIIGKIIHLQADRGWGFIASADVKFTRIFFHWTALQSDTLKFTQLKKGMKVEFIHKVIEGKDRAIKIKVIDIIKAENLKDA